MDLLYLKAKNFNLLREWRLKQERKLWVQTKNKKNSKDYEQWGCDKFYANISKNYSTNV